jgi:hypothetical protein
MDQGTMGNRPKNKDRDGMGQDCEIYSQPAYYQRVIKHLPSRLLSVLNFASFKLIHRKPALKNLLIFPVLLQLILFLSNVNQYADQHPVFGGSGRYSYR